MMWGPLAQLVEHLTLNQQVPGSSPGRPTNKKKHLAQFELGAFLFGSMQVLFFRTFLPETKLLPKVNLKSGHCKLGFVFLKASASVCEILSFFQHF